MILYGATFGGMAVALIVITATSILVTVALARSRIVLREQLNILKAKANEQPVIYEEILQDSLKSSSPSINTGENTAYASAVVVNVYDRISK